MMVVVHCSRGGGVSSLRAGSALAVDEQASVGFPLTAANTPAEVSSETTWQSGSRDDQRWQLECRWFTNWGIIIAQQALYTPFHNQQPATVDVLQCCFARR